MANIELLAREYVGLVGGRPELSDGEAEAADRLVEAMCRADGRIQPVVAAIINGGTLGGRSRTIDDVFLVALSTLGYAAADRVTTDRPGRLFAA